MASTYPQAPSRVPASPLASSIPALTALDAGDWKMGMGARVEPVPEKSAIEKLSPKSTLEGKTRQKLESMFQFSSREMGNFTDRWQWMEHKIQAYVRLPDYKQAMNQLANNNGQAPEPVKIIVPYTYATLHAAATFLFNVLAGRRPVFPLMAVSGTTADKARYMESAVQANLEMSKGYEVLWQYIWDSLIYQFGAARIGWEERNGKMLRITAGRREMVEGLKYAGNRLDSIDPYRCFPDPRVPIHQCSEKGDFFFWTSSQSKMILKDMEKAGLLKWVDEACGKEGNDRVQQAAELPLVADSQRRARIGTAGNWAPTPADVVGFYSLKEGTVRLVPKDWGLGDGDKSELWKFMWTRSQIVQAEPLGMVHEQHPISCTEPTSLGHEFGGLSFADQIGTFQDLISWLVNSRMENVRTTINNQFLANPALVEMQDFRQPSAGKVIRLKQAAIGTPVTDAVRQLMVNDVTQGHFNDIQVLRMLADSVTGINDNMRGVQTAGGRRSATEARMSMQAGASRLSQMAVRISSQGLQGIADQMITNIQQFMPDEMWVQMTGDEGEQMSQLLKPDMVVGSFNYKISDGSLPYDKMAMLEQWKELLFGVAKDPELRQNYDLGSIFNWVAKLGGASNIDQFKRQQPQPQIAAQPPQGSVPVGAATPAAPPTPMNFAAGV